MYISRRNFIWGLSCTCGSSLIFPSCTEVEISGRKQINIPITTINKRIKGILSETLNEECCIKLEHEIVSLLYSEISSDTTLTDSSIIKILHKVKLQKNKVD